MFGYLFLELILLILRIVLQGNHNYADSRRKDVSLFRFFARTLTLQFSFPEDPRGRKGFLVRKFQKSYRLFTFFLVHIANGRTSLVSHFGDFSSGLDAAAYAMGR